MKNNNYFWGVILIFIGILAIVGRVFNISFFRPWDIWPLFILLPGLLFEFSYFTTKKNVGVLVPGGILTTIGCLFLFETITRWHFSGYTWPVYIFAVVVGLFQLYWFGNRQKGLLIPIFILMTIVVISFSNMLFGNVFYWIRRSFTLPIILILIGILLILKKDNKKKVDN